MPWRAIVLVSAHRRGRSGEHLRGMVPWRVELEAASLRGRGFQDIAGSGVLW